ncbi:MAG: carboxypeptidase regulatory-like domain-containing protein [Chitinophagaceae bacterium]|nr:carboxypeptidase regulatory-like domain-containing protein [Chitinophagaceae bacterium]
MEEQFTPIVNPVIPDFTTQVNTSVNGFITDENGNAVEGASVKGGTTTISSDKFGYFKISNEVFAKSAGFVQVSKPGYFTGFRTFLPVEGKETFIRLQLIPKKNAGIIEAAVGGTVLTTDGAKVTLPANGVVVASNNTAYTGAVNISAHWLNPAEEQKTQLTMPGNLTGVDSAGHLNVLVTYGMLAVELTSDAGELLQIASGKKASLSFPIPSSISGTAPASIPLWYFDESKGVWKQEGRAVKNGSNYEGEVNHFSFWNCDVGFPLVNFTVQIVHNGLLPLSNVPVVITDVNMPSRLAIAYTDTSGYVNGLVPANSNLQIKIVAQGCNQNFIVANINTASSDVDLGTVQVNTNQNAAIIQGRVIKCNGNPVTNGFVIVRGQFNNSVIEINNGNFSASTIICPGTNVSVAAIDRETSQQSNMTDILLVTGINNTGEMQACNSSTTELITVNLSINGNKTYTLPQHLFGGNFYFATDSTSISAIDLPINQQAIQFSFTGNAAPGVYPLAGNRFFSGGPMFIFSNPTFVTITSYGLVGQFITGSFAGQGHFDGGPEQSCQVNFNIQRDQ